MERTVHNRTNKPNAFSSSQGTRLPLHPKPQGHGVSVGKQTRPAAARGRMFLPRLNSEEPVLLSLQRKSWVAGPSPAMTCGGRAANWLAAFPVSPELRAWISRRTKPRMNADKRGSITGLIHRRLSASIRGSISCARFRSRSGCLCNYPRPSALE